MFTSFHVNKNPKDFCFYIWVAIHIDVFGMQLVYKEFFLCTIYLWIWSQCWSFLSFVYQFYKLILFSILYDLATYVLHCKYSNMQTYVRMHTLLNLYFESYLFKVILRIHKNMCRTLVIKMKKKKKIIN